MTYTIITSWSTQTGDKDWHFYYEFLVTNQAWNPRIDPSFPAQVRLHNLKATSTNAHWEYTQQGGIQD